MKSLNKLNRLVQSQGKYNPVGGRKCRSKRLRKKATKYYFLVMELCIRETLPKFLERCEPLQYCYETYDILPFWK